MPKAYVLAELTVPDAAAYAASGYMGLAEAAVAAHGGRYLVRGGTVTSLEGGPDPARIVILEFPSRAAAEAFHISAEYTPAKNLRQKLSIARFLVLDGYEPC